MNPTKIILLLLVIQSLGCALPRRDASQTTAEKERQEEKKARRRRSFIGHDK